MTREDRELAIADNVSYVDRVIDAIEAPRGLVYIGFSQGAAMAYRAALLGKHRAQGVIALCGDVPPELNSVPALSWPRVLIGAGVDDSWYTPAKLNADVEMVTTRGITPTVVRFAGGHAWTAEFQTAAGDWLRVLA